MAAAAERLRQDVGEVHDPERRIDRLGAGQRAMAGMVHGDDGVGARRNRALGQAAMDRPFAILEFRRLAAASVGEAGTLHQLDQFEVGHGAQQLADAVDRGTDAEVLVDDDTALRLIDEARLQRLDVGGEEFADVAEIEERLFDVLLQLVEILGAGRAPGQHLRRPGLAEALEGAMAHLFIGRQVGFLELVDAAAVRCAADHVEVELERVEDIHDIEHNVRRPQHVAAGIEKDLGGPSFGRLQDLLQRLRGKLHAGQQPHRLRHVTEAAGRGGGADFARPTRIERLHLGDGDPLADVDALGAGRRTAGTAVTGVEPLLQAFRRRAAVQGQSREFADARLRLARVEADFARRRAGLEALAAAGAAIGRVGDQCFQPVGIGAQRPAARRL